MKSTCKILTEIRGEKRRFGKPNVCEGLTKFMWLRWGVNGGSCGQSNESLGSTKDWGYFHELLDYQLLSNYFITWT